MTDHPTNSAATGNILSLIEARRAERRRFLRYAGGAAAAAGGLAALSACGGDSDVGTLPTPTPTPSSTTSVSEVDVLNFALNLEYLEAQYYSFAANGVALDATLTTGIGTAGTVTGGAQVPFSDAQVAQYAREIAQDEQRHVSILRSYLQGAAVAMPAINIDGTSPTGAFSVAAQAAGLVAAGGVFNPYLTDESFLLGAFLFEDVGVTAYKGASPLLTTSTYIETTAGILATEAYHAGLIRSVLYRKGIQLDPTIFASVQAISDARDSLDGAGDDDQGIGTASVANITPADANAIAYSRSPGQVLNVAYLSKASVTKGGFFPSGTNGNLFTSAASG